MKLFREPDKSLATLLHILKGNTLQIKKNPETVLRHLEELLPDLNNYLSGLSGYNATITKRLEVGNIDNIKKLIDVQTEMINRLLEWKELFKKTLTDNS